MSRFFSTAYEESSDEENLVSSDEEPLYSSEESSEEELLDEDEEDEEGEKPEPANGGEGDDDDDDDSEFWDEDSSSEDESDDDSYGGGKPKGRNFFLKKEFLKDGADAGAKQKEKKVVKSAKEKYLDEVAELVDQIETSSMTNDWIQMADQFDNLLKLVAKYPQHHIAVPRQYVRCLDIVQNALAEHKLRQKETKQKLNASQSKAVNILRQRLKRSSREYAPELAAFKKDPEVFLAGDGATSLSVTPSLSTLAGSPMPRDSSSPVAGAAAKASAKASIEIFNGLKAILDSRGKRNVDQKEQLVTLQEYTARAASSYEKIMILLLKIPVRFDLFSRVNYMPPQEWKAALTDVRTLLDILDKDRKYAVTETATVADDIAVEPTANAHGRVEIVGSIASFIERLADEISANLLALDPHSTEYIMRLRDEAPLYTQILRTQLYYERVIPAAEYSGAQGSQLARVVLKRLESIYYKPTQLVTFSEMTAWKAVDAKENSQICPRILGDNGPQNLQYTNGLVDSLCSVLYKQANSVFRKKAVLCHIYNYALNDQYYKARDMLLLSHLQSSIHTADPQLQIHFNRALVQLGLSAFRLGLIHETQQLLQEIATSPRQKELLGQGVQRFQVQQSQVDKQRLLPFHMHINLELLECSFYTASLLIEVPLMAQYADYVKRRQSSPKAFRRVLEYRSRQVFDGPPENARDRIMLAARALGNCEWKKAAELLKQIKIWGLFKEPEALMQIVLKRLQVEALRTFVFKNRGYFTKCSLANLAELFELSQEQVQAVLSKLIRNDDIDASINLKTNTLDFVHAQHTKPNKLQELVLSLGDKCSQIIDRNDKLAAAGYQVPIELKAGKSRK